MKALALLVVLAACGKDAPASVTITAKAPAAGQVSIAQIEKHSTETLTMQGTDLVIQDDHTERRRTEVLEVSATSATKVKVTYEAREQKETTEGETKAVPSPVVGKTYVVWRDGAQIRATVEDAPVAADELAILADDHEDLGRTAEMEALITGRVWKRGEAVKFDAGQLADLDHERGVTAEGTQTTAATVTMTGVANGVATFTAVMQVETDNASVALSSTLTGTVKVEIAQARPVEISMNVSGKGVVLSGRAAGAQLQITNRGTQTYLYQ